MPGTTEAPRQGPQSPRPSTDFSDFFDTMFDEAKEYVVSERTYIALLLSKRVAEVTRSLVGSLAITLIAAGILLFASVAGALALGRAMGDMASGFLLVAGGYAVILLVFALLWRGGMGDRFKLRIINMLNGH